MRADIASFKARNRGRHRPAVRARGVIVPGKSHTPDLFDHCKILTRSARRTTENARSSSRRYGVPILSGLYKRGNGPVIYFSVHSQWFSVRSVLKTCFGWHTLWPGRIDDLPRGGVLIQMCDSCSVEPEDDGGGRRAPLC